MPLLQEHTRRAGDVTAADGANVTTVLLDASEARAAQGDVVARVDADLARLFEAHTARMGIVASECLLLVHGDELLEVCEERGVLACRGQGEEV